jgi:hypothetical protein
MGILLKKNKIKLYTFSLYFIFAITDMAIVIAVKLVNAR